MIFLGPDEIIGLAIILTLIGAERYWHSKPAVQTRVLGFLSSIILGYVTYTIWGNGISILEALTIVWGISANLVLVISPKKSSARLDVA